MNVLQRLQRLEDYAAQKQADNELIDGITLTDHIAPIYYDLDDDIKAAKHDYYRLPGGRGSAKSSFVSLEIVDGVMKDHSGQSNAIVFRRYGTTLRDSCYSQIQWAVDQLGVSQYWQSSVSPMQFTFIPTGAQILFRGLDDSSKIKSIRPKHGTFRYVWIEEFSELPGVNFTRNVLQSVVRGGDTFAIFQTFNPPQSISNWANVYVETDDDRAITLRTTFLDVPREWLGEMFYSEAEKLQQINPVAYNHEYLGECTATGGQVFPNIELKTITDDDISKYQHIYGGIDFGFSIDPAVYMRVAYRPRTDEIVLLDEIYKHHISNAELAALIQEKGYDKAGTQKYVSMFGETYEERQLITADSAEPKSIADLQNCGLKVIPCKKFAGSIIYGVKWLQHRKIIIDPKRTPYAYKEFVQYEYLKDRDGQFISDIDPKAACHCIDAVRYACDRLINNRRNSA